jgi:pullulanase-type alpha-1,6-glucosidase
MSQRKLRRLLPSVIGILAMALGTFSPLASFAPLGAGRIAAPVRSVLAEESTIILDGLRDVDYIQIATDPSGDLPSPGPVDWTGTQWTDLTALSVAADSTTLYIYADLPGYFESASDPGNDSSGQIGLAIDVDGNPGSGGSADAWGNSLAFAYSRIDGFSTSNTFLPDYLIRGDVSNDGGWTELRTWNGSDWNSGAGVNWGGISAGDIGTHVAYADGQGVELAIPLADLGSPDPAQLHLEFFATQGGATKGAFDTLPSDDQSNGWDDPTTQANLVSVPLAVDSPGDLATPGPAEWEGTFWTDLTRLHIWADDANLYLYVPMAQYDPALSAGQLGLAIDTGPGGGGSDPWANAITFAYAFTNQNLGASPTAASVLPDYLIRGNIFGPADNGWTELRTWNGSDWNTGAGVDWGGIGDSGSASQPGSKVAWSANDGLRLRIPFSDLAVSAGDTLNLEFFGTQGGAAKGAYDTVPSDDQSVGWDDATTQQYLATFTIPTITIPSGLEPGDELLVRPVLEHPFENQVLYFTMPDRFANGDTANDCGDYAGTCVAGDTEANVLTHGFLPSDRGYYHGGDISGLHDKLDYLAGMGITAVWVGPIYLNQTVQPDSSNLYGYSSGYHGYWILDFTQVDPHLGTNAEFESMVNDAHALGIKVFMDIVTNHTADVIQLSGSAYRNKTDYPYLDTTGTPFDDSDYAYYGQPDYTFPEVDLDSFPYQPSLPAGKENIKNPSWLNDPLLYHNRGDTSFTGENSLYGDFYGLDDLWTERKEVVDGMIDIFQTWIHDFGVDGFRIDTTKHVNMEFWQKFGPDILAAAEADGIADFFAFGEVYDQTFGPSFISEFSTRGKLQSTIDFGFQLAARDFASQSGATDNLRDFFEQDDYYTDADSNAYAMPTFVGNHDMGRIGYFLTVDNPGAPDAELLARSKLAHALMFFARGQPVIYYGDEQGFVGDGGDKLARQDMFPSQVPEYNDDDLIGTDATTAADNFDPTHPIYQALGAYARVYQAHKALRSGAQIHRFSTSGPGVYAFSRIDRDEKIEYLVAFNDAETASQASVPTFYGAGQQFDLLYAEGGSAAASLTTDADGHLALDVPALGFVIYQATDPIPASSAAPGILISSLVNGQEVTLLKKNEDGHDVVDRIEVRAELSSDIYAEVTFAASVNGGAYEPIGTDNNPPYRVFYDVTSLPEGATLSFKAIVNDLSGNLNAAKVTGILPVIQEPTPPPTAAVPYAVIHYFRADGDYGDHTTGDYNDFWGLHLWGDIDETIAWTAPKPFLGEDEYGRFAWVKLTPNASNVGFIVHRGDTKDGTDADRFFNPGLNPEIWLKGGDPTTYTSQAEAQGYVTINYHRDDGDYGDPTSNDFNDFWGLHLWGDAIDPSEATEWTIPKPPTGFNDYGPFWDIQIVDASQPVNFIIHRGDAKDPGPDQSSVPLEDATIWIMSGDETIYPQRGAAQHFATVHYHRADGDYGDPTSPNFNDFWGLHVWDGAAFPNPSWQEPVRPTGFDFYGPFFEIALQPGAAQLAYIIHRGDAKDPGPDQFLTFDPWGYEVWQLEGEGPDPDQPHYVLPILAAAGPNPGNINEQRAYWVSQDTIAWAAAEGADNTYTLNYAPDGGLEATDAGVTGGTAIPLNLDPAGLPAAVVEKFPHLAGLPALKIAAEHLPLVPEILKGQMAVSAVDSAGLSVDATGLQIPGVLDDLYTYTGDLGVTWDGNVPTIRVWAPTAKSVTFHLFADSDPATTGTTTPMALDPETGVWSLTGDPNWKGDYYLFEVEVYVNATQQVEHNLVTDPYSLSLSMNSTRSQIVDLSDAALKPDGWDTLEKPALAAPEDISLYEIHVRDFSASDPRVPEELKGTYKAFTLSDTFGVDHLKALVNAGLTHLHLMPVFDIATIDEDKSTWQSPDPDVLATYPPDSEEQQAAVSLTADLDGFNWGYDPYHYTTPEGSYATNPDGSARIFEFREMVEALNHMGLRVVMDVVYNHTNASGQAERSVLDRIVPGYYHRLDDKGAVTTSTCCPNTASENNMMEKLMIDSLLTWATQYKVDGFRFDLMGHHMKRNMQAVRAAFDALTPAQDGVDGQAIYMYGEGWNFGEVADNARGVNATQLNMGGTGIGTFNDRQRDAVRGVGPFDSGEGLLDKQGFANGSYYDTKDTVPGTPDEQLARLLLQSDQIRVGMAGNLAGYEFIDRNGNLVTGSQVDYNGQPAGYTEDPQEDIAYVSAHDNQTLFDINVYAAPQASSMADRVRIQNMGLSTVLLGQGVPFTHAGSDLLRSKSLDRDSYNSGDWFNKLDFSYQSNNFGVGLPVANRNEGDWDVMRPLLADPDLQPDLSDVEFSAALYQELLRIRYSSPLFRLHTAAEIQKRLAFHNTGPDQLPGLIVMSLSDLLEPDLDRGHELIVVLINANDEAQSIALPELAGLDLVLHLVQFNSADELVKTASFDTVTGTFSVPGRTTAVFEFSPQEMLRSLIAEVGALVDSGSLNKGQGNALTVKLNNAIQNLDRDKAKTALNNLNAFTNQVEDLVADGILTPAEGQSLIEAAEAIATQIQVRYQVQ